MEIHQLRYLVLLAEELSFTRAAARGNVAQPALSRQIRKLEDELGIPLVDRTTRQVRLTPAGLDLVARARRVLAEVDEARAVAREAVALLSGRVTIGMTETPGPLDVAALLGAFHQQHPGVELALREDLSVSLADRLRGDELDLAFVSGVDQHARRGLTFLPLAAEPLCLVVAPGHRLAGRRQVRVAELRDERLVAFPPGATIRATFDAAARTAGFAPQIAFESNDRDRTRALVHHGLGVALLPASDTRAPGPEVVVLPFRERRALTHELFAAWRTARRLTPAAAAFLSTMRSLLSV